MNDGFDPDALRRWGTTAGRATRFWFRFRLRETQRIPSGPCLIVGNHSALGTAEVMCLLGGWFHAFGATRRVVGLMHDWTLGLPVVGHFYRSVGAVPASRRNAEQALKAGHALLVFPGGDLDACRPFYYPRKVFFGDRRGYVRLALESNVPVIPLATIGSHYALLMFPGGALLARALGLKRLLRIERVPLPMGLFLAASALLAWATGWISATVGCLLVTIGLIRTPVRITSELLPPIDLTEAVGHLETEAERVEHAHWLVHGRLQDAVRRMRHNHPLGTARS